MKDSFLSVANGFCRPVQKAGPYPVAITYQFSFATRPLDTLNCAYMAKMAEDSLRTLGILEDDDPAHVTKAIIEVKSVSKKEEDSLAITINSL